MHEEQSGHDQDKIIADLEFTQIGYGDVEQQGRCHHQDKVRGGHAPPVMPLERSAPKYRQWEAAKEIKEVIARMAKTQRMLPAGTGTETKDAALTWMALVQACQL